jgi:Holliday junction DNA helicase RuvB
MPRSPKASDPLRPTTLAEYIGQAPVKEALTVAIGAAKKEGRTLDHILVNGPPGLGKTTLARIIAHEMSAELQTSIGSSLKTSGDIRGLIGRVRKPGTLVFIDEIHRVSKAASEVLYPVMEDGLLLFMVDKGSPIELNIPALTLIGATTNMGALAQPFVDRFGLQFQLEYYSPDEMIDLALINTEKMGIDYRQDALEAVIARSRSTPRVLNRLLRRLKDYQVFLGTALHKDQVIDILWNKMGLDDRGLNKLDRKVLKVLNDSRGSLGLEALAAMVREEPSTIIERVEPYLLQIGFMERGKSGRMITPRGSAHINGLRLVKGVA